MREFEKFEIFKTKCPVCGSRNKVHTEIMNADKELVGYSLKCCGCGNYNQFLLDYITNGKRKKLPYINGEEICIQPSYCPKVDCPLYKKCKDKPDKNPRPTRNKEEINTNMDIHVFNKPKFL
jgi:hypothetical protein